MIDKLLEQGLKDACGDKSDKWELMNAIIHCGSWTCWAVDAPKWQRQVLSSDQEAYSHLTKTKGNVTGEGI